MRFSRSFLFAFAFLIPFFLRATLVRADIQQLQSQFAQPPDDARIMVRWWWFGPAVTKPQLEREMNLMKQGGIGGFEVQPTYPLALDNQPAGVVNLKFLSPEFLDALNFTASKAKDLGLRMDLTLGSGWPYGGPMFASTEAAGRLRTQAVRVAAGQTTAAAPALRAGESLITAFASPMQGNRADYSKTEQAALDNNTAQLPADISAPAEVRFFIASRTGMQVKRPALGAEGNVIDGLNASVVDKFIKQIAEPEINACGANPPHSIFCDSLEVNGEDWTDDFLAEFQKRRGYDLRPLLPALVQDIGPKTLDIRHDWGQTLTELFNDRFASTFTKLAHAHDTRFRIQAYGSPSAGLFTYANTDLPEGEGYQWHGYRATRYASSASHLMGVPVSSSETFTWLHSPVFRATPLDMKAEADLHFLQGVNQIICHGWPYTPPQAAAPGWSFYASADFNQNNPWWIVMPDVTKYLQRTSFLMRQGHPANDVLLYLSNSDAWAAFTPGRISLTDGVGQKLGNEIVGRILDSGYNLDFVDDQMLAQKGRVEGDSLAFGDLRYKVIVLAGVERMPLATLKTLEQFAKNGGTVIATRRLPAIVPGYQTPAEDQAALRQIVQHLFSDPAAPGIFQPDESQFAAALGKRLPPDFALAAADSEIGFVHRHLDDGEIYFVANTSNQSKTLKAKFRVADSKPEIWDLISGFVRPANPSEQTGDTNTLALQLPPYGSTVIAFTKRNLPAQIMQSAALSMDISTDWTVKFGDAAPVAMPKLHSWTDDAATRNFSGVAVYEKTIAFAPSMPLESIHDILLNFGPTSPGRAGGARGGNGGMQANLNVPVHDAAVVYINDQRAGSVWCPPYSLNIAGLLKPGENKIRIEAANTAVNAIAAHGFPNYDYAAITRAFGNRFQPQDISTMQPVTSGLLGPIRIESRDGPANP